MYIYRECIYGESVYECRERINDRESVSRHKDCEDIYRVCVERGIACACVCVCREKER